MNGLRRSGTAKLAHTRPAIPAVTYQDEISDAAWKKLREAVAEFNEGEQDFRCVEGLNIPQD
jgi:hypothetical protein